MIRIVPTDPFNRAIAFAFTLLVLFLFSAWYSSSLDLHHYKDAVVAAGHKLSGNKPDYAAPSTGPVGDKIIVMAHRESENTSWVAEYLPDWQRAIYSVDNENAPLRVEYNKGREANVYLTYIISHYDHLPSIITFIHAHHLGIDKAWHVDAPEFDNVYLLNKLKLDFVRRNGYVNLRCRWLPGCPDEIQPFRDHEGLDIENMPDKKYLAESQIRRVWPDLFPGEEIPTLIATPCCAEFAITREQVLKRPVTDYQRMHRWLRDTDINESDVGRIFEYLWHIVFGQEPVYCPDVNDCYEDVFGGSY